MSQLETILTTSAVVTIVIGLVLLFLGVKLVRVVFTVVLAGLGAAVGQAIAFGLAAAKAPDVQQWSWAVPIGGAVFMGLIGFLLCRIWVIASFGALLAALSAVGYLGIMGGGTLERVAPKAGQVSAGFLDTLVLSRHIAAIVQRIQGGEMSAEDRRQLDEVRGHVAATTAKFDRGQLPLSPDALVPAADWQVLNALMNKYAGPEEGDLRERVERLMRLKDVCVDLGGEFQALGKNYGLGMSIAAAVGLMVGLLLGALAWRLAAVVMTSLWGTLLILLAGFALALWHKPTYATQFMNMGWKAWLGPGGAWLMGLSLQGLLARRRRKRAPEAEPVEAEAASDRK